MSAATKKGQISATRGHPAELDLLQFVCRQTAVLRDKDEAFAMKLYYEPAQGICAVQSHLENFPFSRFPTRDPNNKLMQYVVRSLADFFMVEREYQARGLMKKNQTMLQPPIFILGLTGTGSTLLHMLLSQDPGARAVLKWEALFACHPGTSEDRIKMAHKYDMTEPRISTAELPDESHIFINHALAPIGLQTFSSTIDGKDAIIQWCIQKEHLKRMYQFHSRFTQVLYAQSDRSSPKTHWVFKDPMHLQGLESLLQVYPNARIIWTHRKLKDLAFCEAGRLRMLGLFPMARQHLELFGRATGEAIKKRDAHGNESQFFDVYFEDLVADPVETVSKIYSHFGIAEHEEYTAKMKGWLSANFRPARNYGLTLNDLGLTSDQALHGLFKEYVARFPKTAL